jgi:hypothetical protein
MRCDTPPQLEIQRYRRHRSRRETGSLGERIEAHGLEADGI